MTLIDAEFEKIALATNPSDAQEIAAAIAAADAKAIADAKAANAKAAALVANVKTHGESELDRLTKEIVKSNPGWKESKVREDLTNQMKAKALQETLPFRYNQDIKYKACPLTPFIRLYDGLIKQDIQVTTNIGD